MSIASNTLAMFAAMKTTPQGSADTSHATIAGSFLTLKTQNVEVFALMNASINSTTKKGEDMTRERNEIKTLAKHIMRGITQVEIWEQYPNLNFGDLQAISVTMAHETLGRVEATSDGKSLRDKSDD